MRITNRRELKKYLTERIFQSQVFAGADPSRYDAINELCNTLLKSPFLKYTETNNIDKASMEALMIEFESIYSEFMDAVHNQPADMTAAERDNLKQIIEYLQKITDSRDKLIESWKLLLSSWDVYPKSIQNWPNLRYIRRNLQTMITILKNRHKNGREQKDNKARQDFSAVAAELAYRSSQRHETKE